MSDKHFSLIFVLIVLCMKKKAVDPLFFTKRVVLYQSGFLLGKNYCVSFIFTKETDMWLLDRQRTALPARQWRSLQCQVMASAENAPRRKLQIRKRFRWQLCSKTRVRSNSVKSVRDKDPDQWLLPSSDELVDRRTAWTAGRSKPMPTRPFPTSRRYEAPRQYCLQEVTMATKNFQQQAPLRVTKRTCNLVVKKREC